MPAYSFQERFVPFVLEGSKPHTMRKRSKRKVPKVGDTLFLYFGLRTKWCKKLREEKCTEVHTVIIYHDDENILQLVIFNKRFEYSEFKITDNKVFVEPSVYSDGFKLLLGYELEKFAWLDGFRPKESSLESPYGAWELMQRWWKQTHELPFVGDLICWQPSSESKVFNYVTRIL